VQNKNLFCILWLLQATLLKTSDREGREEPEIYTVWQARRLCFSSNHPMNSSRLWLWHYHALLSFRKGNLTDDCYELKPQPKPDNTPWQYCQAKRLCSHWFLCIRDTLPWAGSVRGCIVHTVGISKGMHTDLGRSRPPRAESLEWCPWSMQHLANWRRWCYW
jgi:hypothetical protein